MPRALIALLSGERHVARISKAVMTSSVRVRFSGGPVRCVNGLGTVQVMFPAVFGILRRL